MVTTGVCFVAFGRITPIPKTKLKIIRIPTMKTPAASLSGIGAMATSRAATVRRLAASTSSAAMLRPTKPMWALHPCGLAPLVPAFRVKSLRASTVLRKIVLRLMLLDVNARFAF